MSRTYRRKNDFYWDSSLRKVGGQWLLNYGKDTRRDLIKAATVEIHDVINYFHWEVPEGSEVFKMAKANFHRDDHNKAWGMPSDFVNMYATRPNHAKNRTNCRKMTVDPDYWYEADFMETDDSKGIAWLWD